VGMYFLSVGNVFQSYHKVVSKANENTPSPTRETGCLDRRGGGMMSEIDGADTETYPCLVLVLLVELMERVVQRERVGDLELSPDLP